MNGVVHDPAVRQPTTDRRAWVEQIMGMPISVHVRGSGARSPEVAGAVAALLGDLRDADAMFSTYREDSEVRRLQRGDLSLADADPLVREVHRLCKVARLRTDGWFDAWSAVPGEPGLFDPTGLVKTWAVARSALRLEDLPGLGFAIGAGGDVLLSSPEGAPPWRIGIEDPKDRSRVLATVTVQDGGVATSGLAARGAHILSPRTGLPATEVLSATVVGPSLMWADVWATAAVARGTAVLDWVSTLEGTSGLLVLADGTVHRWGAVVAEV